MYRVETSSESIRGRFVVADRTIRAGDVILHDKPFVVVPPSKTVPICVSCFKFYGNDDGSCRSVCVHCEFPLCSDGTCVHETEECRALSRIKTPFLAGTTSPLFMALGPLRLLLRSKQDPIGWNKVRTLEDHDLERRADTKTWMLHHVLIVAFIQKALQITEFSTSDIQKAIGIIKTNSVRLESKRGHAIGLAIYPDYSMVNHSCIFNARTQKNREDGSLELIAVVDIEKDHEIFTRYVTPQLGTLRRQELLQSHWYFACRCERCTDPTELGSHLNTLMCFECGSYVVPDNPIDVSSSWKCQGCSDRMSSNDVKKLILDFNTKFERNRKNVDELEALLTSEAASAFHPNHFLCTGIRETIVKEAENFERRTLDHFRRIVEVMIKVDRPVETWKRTLANMENRFQERQGNK